MRHLFAAAIDVLAREQDRWFLWTPVLLGCGIASYFALTTEPSSLVAIGALSFALILRWRWRESTAAALIGGSLLVVVLGFALAQFRTFIVSAPVLPTERSAHTISGWVELVEPREQRGARLTLRVHSMSGLDVAQQPVRIRLRTLTSVPDLQAGDSLRVRAMLSPPAGPALPGGYDFARQAWFLSLGAVGYALSAPERIAITAPMPWDLWMRTRFNRLRQGIAARIRAVLPDERGAIAVALITGERGGISAATNAAYRDSGLIHILSISGLHMAIMAGAMFFSTRFVLSLMPRVALRHDIRKWAAVAGCAGALGYLAISGASPPAVRSFLMVLIMFLAILLDRPALALRNVALAALLMLGFMSESLIDVGFQMSFAAVVALVAGYEAWRDRRTAENTGPPGNALLRAPLFFLGGIVVSTLLASLAVAPFGIYHFHQSQQYAMLANLLAVPAVNLLIMPAALATLIALPLGLEAAPLHIMGAGISLMSAVADRVAALPGSVVRIAAIPSSSFGLIVLGGAWLLLWRTRLRLWGLTAIAAGLTLAPLGPRPDVLISRSGALVAARDDGGRLWAVAGRREHYDLGRWLERDGDGRTPAQLTDAAQDKGAGLFRCDTNGCLADVRGRRLAVPRHAAALRDDCAQADIVILQHDRPVHCVRPALVIDRNTLRWTGAQALWFQADQTTIVTVAGVHGTRPWSASPARVSQKARPALSESLPVSSPKPRAGLIEVMVPGRGWHAPPE